MCPTLDEVLRVVAIKCRGFYRHSTVLSYSNSLIIEMKLFSSLFVIASMMVVGGFAAAAAGATLMEKITICTDVTSNYRGMVNSLTISSTNNVVCLLCHLCKSYIDD